MGKRPMKWEKDQLDNKIRNMTREIWKLDNENTNSLMEKECRLENK